MASPSPPPSRAELRRRAEQQYGTVEAAVEKSPGHFFLVDDCANAADLKSNRDMVLAAVTHSPFNLQYASVSLQNDKEIVLAAIQVDGRALIYASEDLQNDEEVVLAAVSANGNHLLQAKWQQSFLRSVKDKFKNSEKIVLAAVQAYGLALEYATPDLQNNETIVMAAVQQNGNALQYAGRDLRNNETIVMAAVQQNGNALQYASSKLQNDKTIVLAAVQQSGLAYQAGNQAFLYASSDLQNDEIVVSAAARAGFGLIRFEEKWRSNEKVVLAAVQACGTSNNTELSHASDELRSKEPIVLAALANPRSDPKTIMFVSPDLRKKIMDAKRKCNVSCQEYAAARMKGSVVIHVSSVLRSEAALTVACATVAGDEYTVELNPRTENSTAVLRDKIAPKIDVPPAILDILLDEGQLCSPHSDLQICRD